MTAIRPTSYSCDKCQEQRATVTVVDGQQRERQLCDDCRAWYEHRQVPLRVIGFAGPAGRRIR